MCYCYSLNFTFSCVNNIFFFSEDYEFESSKSHYTSSLSDVKHTPSESADYSDESYDDHHGAAGYSADPKGPPIDHKRLPSASSAGATAPTVQYLDNGKAKAEESAMDTFV